MPTADKKEKVEKLAASMAEAKAIYLADFTGIDVARVTALRDELREANVGYEVVKNRLAIRAAEVAGIDGLEEHLAGPTAIAISKEDLIAPAKILQNLADDEEMEFSIKSGYADGKLLSPEEVKRLSDLPSREELIAKILGSIQSPMYGIASVTNGLLLNFVGVIAAIEEKRKSEAADS